MQMVLRLWENGEMIYINRFIKWLKYNSEKILLGIMLIIFTFSFFSDANGNPPFAFMKWKVVNKNDFIYTLFGIQASMATIGITLVSVVAGFINESIYGISVLKYIADLKPKIFKFKVVATAGIVSVFLNYVFIAYDLTNMSISLFILTVLAIIIMSQNTFIALFDKSNLKFEIENYIITNINIELLNSLQDEIILSSENGKIYIVADDFELLEKIFSNAINNYEMNKESGITQDELIINIQKSCQNIISKIVYQHDANKSKLCIELIISIYNIANKSKKLIPLHLWEDVECEFWVALKDLNVKDISDHGIVYQLRMTLYENMRYKNKDEIEALGLQYFSTRLYANLILNRNLMTENEKEIMQRSIYDNLMFFVLTNYENDNINEIVVWDLVNLSKILIDNGDINFINKIFKNFHYMNDKYATLVLMIIFIYLYYIIYKENLVKGGDIQQNAIKSLEWFKKEMRNWIFYVHFSNIICEKYKFIYKIMDKMEYIGDDVKKMIMYDVMNDFFIFSGIATCSNDEQMSNIIDAVRGNSLLSIYARYFDSSGIEKIKSMYAEYLSLFWDYKESGTYEEKLFNFKELMAYKYQQEIMNEGETNKFNPEKINQYCENIKCEIQRKISDDFKLFEILPNQEVKSNENVLITYWTVESIFFDSSRSVKNDIENAMAEFISYFLNKTMEKIEYRTVDYKNSEKQKYLINLAEAKNIQANVFIGQNRRYINEKDINLLSNYTSQMDHIHFSRGYNYVFLLNSKFIEFKYADIRVEYRNLRWDEIEKKYCKYDENKIILFNVTNDLYIPMNRDQIINYINNTRKVIEVYANVRYRFSGEKVGVGMRIKYDN